MQCSFLKKCIFPFSKLFSLRSITQNSFKTPDSYTICNCVINIEHCREKVQWLMLIAAFLEKERLLLNEHVAYTICLEDRMVPGVGGASARKLWMWKDEIHPLMELSLPLIFLVWPSFKERPNFCKIIALKPEDKVFPQLRSSILAEKNNCGKMQCNKSFDEVQHHFHFFWTTVVFWSFWESDEWNFRKGATPGSFEQLETVPHPRMRCLSARYAAYFVQVLHSYNMDGHIAYMAYRHPWTAWTVSFKRYYIHPRVLLHSNVSLYYWMVFNQMVHCLVKEALHILAPTLSLRNTIIG